MGRAKTDSFILELPLRTTPTQEKRLLARLEAARQVYNACLGESLRRLALLRQSKAHRAARRLPKGPGQAKARTLAFREANGAVGFREYDLHAYAVQFNHAWTGEHLDIHVIQKLATRAFKAVQQHSFGRRGRPRFKGKNQMDSLEGKSNASGIRWREECVEWLELKLEAIIDRDDPVIAHGLAARIKYVRLVRRKIEGCNRFYVQLVCEGKPYRKPKNYIGQGEVGLDQGPSTIAAVGEEEAFLAQFCDELFPRQKEIRRFQRKIDRQRRANNPDNYNPDGTIKPGPKEWYKSGRQLRMEAALAELSHRRSLHGQMVNRILRMGNVIKMEKLSYRAFQRMYGRSVGMRAPGMFVVLLKRGAESADASVYEFPTRPTKLSQTCHGCGKVAEKPLSQRWHRCECGVVAQRDLYSAFLARCVEGDRLNADRARREWSEGVDNLLQAALSQIQEPASGSSSRRLPSSFGLSRGQRQSGSPVKCHVKSSEAQDVVPPLNQAVGELTDSLSPREPWRIVRTSRL